MKTLRLRDKKTGEVRPLADFDFLVDGANLSTGGTDGGVDMSAVLMLALAGGGLPKSTGPTYRPPEVPDGE